MCRVMCGILLCVHGLFGVPLLEQIHAYFLYKNRSYPQALSLYESLYAQQKHCENAYNLANVYYKMGVYASAVRLYQEGLELPCKETYYPLLWHNLGNAFFALGRYVEAYHAFENAQNLKPNTATHQNLAITRTLLEQKQTIAAIITKPKAQDSQDFENLTPLLAPQIAKPQDAGALDLGSLKPELKPW